MKGQIVVNFVRSLNWNRLASNLHEQTYLNRIVPIGKLQFTYGMNGTRTEQQFSNQTANLETVSVFISHLYLQRCKT